MSAFVGGPLCLPGRAGRDRWEDRKSEFLPVTGLLFVLRLKGKHGEAALPFFDATCKWNTYKCSAILASHFPACHCCFLIIVLFSMFSC